MVYRTQTKPPRTPLVQRRPRVHKDDYLAFIRTLPCVICGLHPCEACHVRYSNLQYGKRTTGVGIKPDDRWAVPMCSRHHREQHSRGERIWWEGRKIDPLVIAAMLFSAFMGDDKAAAEMIASSARLYVGGTENG